MSFQKAAMAHDDAMVSIVRFSVIEINRQKALPLGAWPNGRSVLFIWPCSSLNFTRLSRVFGDHGAGFWCIFHATPQATENFFPKQSVHCDRPISQFQTIFDTPKSENDHMQKAHRCHAIIALVWGNHRP